MLFNELNIPIPFYDDIYKQNRFQDKCAFVCDYKLLFPISTILPFQIKIDKNIVFDVQNFYVKCTGSDNIYLDLSNQVSAIQQEQKTTADFFTYNGTDFSSVYLPCGSYYMEIIFGLGSGSWNGDIKSYYSEVFFSTDINNNNFSQMKFPLWTSWRFHDDLNKTNKFKSNCESSCDYYLQSAPALLPAFQIKEQSGGIFNVNVFELISIDGNCVIDLTELIQIANTTEWNYAIFNGDVSGFDIPCGKYYGHIVIDGIEYFGEYIEVNGSLDIETFYILQETGDKILQENLGGLIQE